MKTYTFHFGSYGSPLKEGVVVQADEKLGQVVYLGEAGRGRRYEKVALDRRFPAEVTNGRVFDAEPIKVTLPARDGKPERVFFVLAKPKPGIADDRVLVRINTETSYVRGAYGRWTMVKGELETLISGHGANGIAGRVGSWADGLVVMKPGDALRVYPSRGDSWALWIDAAGNPQAAIWQDFENLQALEAAEEQLADAQVGGLEIRYGMMPAYTWHSGSLTPGLELKTGATGQVVELGEYGRGRRLTKVPVIGINPITQESEDDEMMRLLNPRHKSPEVVLEAAVAVLDENKGIYALTNADSAEPGAFLVRVSTQRWYRRGTSGLCQVHRGSPVLITMGKGAHGDAGAVCNWTDSLYVLREGDVLYVQCEGDKVNRRFVLLVENGQLQTEAWRPWELADARRYPSFYLAQGRAAWGHVPEGWIGRVVTLTPVRYLYEYDYTGVLISTNPFVLRMRQDGGDRSDQTFYSGLWVKLEPDKKVTI